MTGPDPTPRRASDAKTSIDVVRWIGGSEGESDWAVVQVDREIKAPQVKVRTAATPAIAKGTRVTVIGYPIGLPLKLADNAQVRDLNSKSFIANLDTYGGNSGSAVFNTEKLARGELLVEGILVSGAQDFLTLLNNTCYVSQQCSNAGCSGERVTRISVIAVARKAKK